MVQVKKDAMEDGDKKRIDEEVRRKVQCNLDEGRSGGGERRFLGWNDCNHGNAIQELSNTRREGSFIQVKGMSSVSLLLVEFEISQQQ